MRINLIRERKASELTQAETAKILGISGRQYQALESGTSDGSMKVWLKLKKLFGISIDTLLENSTKRKNGQ